MQETNAVVQKEEVVLSKELAPEKGMVTPAGIKVHAGGRNPSPHRQSRPAVCCLLPRVVASVSRHVRTVAVVDC